MSLSVYERVCVRERQSEREKEGGSLSEREFLCTVPSVAEPIRRVASCVFPRLVPGRSGELTEKREGGWMWLHPEAPASVKTSTQPGRRKAPW